MSYPRQLELKQQMIDDSFRHSSESIGGARRWEMIHSPKTLHYRNKIEFSFGKFIVGKKKNEEVWPEQPDSATPHSQWNIWFHKQGQFSKVLDIDQCFLISAEAHAVFICIKKLCLESGLPVYDQMRHEWFFRHLVMREWVQTNQLMINLVISDDYFQSSEWVITWASLRANLIQWFTEYERLRNHVTTFLITTNNGLADIVKTEQSNISILWWDGVIYESLELSPYQSEKVYNNKEETEIHTIKATFRVWPFSFFQTNTYGAEKLFSAAIKLIWPQTGTILDLYCGTGTIGISLLKAGIGKRLIGIEIVPQAIQDAQYNASINGLWEQSTWYAGKAEQVVKLPAIANQLAQLSLVVVDPPRDGMHPDMITFLLHLKTQYQYKLCYISCNPVTLARDINLLYTGGMKTQYLQPVDMFPHTHHVEMISILV